MEHTYAAQRGGRHFKERRPVIDEEDPKDIKRPSPLGGSEAGATDAEYESDFEVDKEPITRAEEEANQEYDNDSFIIDDDGANKDGDLTASSEGSHRNKVSNRDWIFDYIR